MKKYKDHFFKITKISTISVLLIFIYSCGNKQTTQFCEGVSPKGKGVNCGTTFSTGDVTALIKPSAKIKNDSVSIKVFNKTESTKKFLFSNSVKTAKDKDYIIHNIRFLNPGTYEIVTIDGKQEISVGSINIVE